MWQVTLFQVSLVKGSVLTPDSGPPWDLRMGLSVVMTEGIGLAAVSWFKGCWMFGGGTTDLCHKSWSLFFESWMFAALVMLWLVISQENLLGCPTSRQNLLEQAKGSTGANERWKPSTFGHWQLSNGENGYRVYATWKIGDISRIHVLQVIYIYMICSWMY